MDEWAHPELLLGDVHVWFASIPSAAAAQGLDCVLDAEERARAARFQFDGDRSAFVFRWGALRMLLARYVDAAAPELRFRRVQGGKPFLARAVARSRGHRERHL